MSKVTKINAGDPGDVLKACLKCNDYCWHTNDKCNVCALKNMPVEALLTEWGGSLCAIIDGEVKNIADHLNELERQ